jgi:hypothetical protein
MRAVLLIAAALCLCAFAAQTQGSKKKPPDIEVLEARARRDNGRITVDGRVRATAAKPLRDLVLVFDFLSAEGGVVSSEKTQVEEYVLQPQQEASYGAVTTDPARAVRYAIRAFSGKDRQLRVANAGPFVIEE